MLGTNCISDQNGKEKDYERISDAMYFLSRGKET